MSASLPRRNDARVRRRGNALETTTILGGVPAAPRTLFLVRSAATMPRLRTACEQEGPEPLRRRGLLAPPGFLTMA